MSADGSDEMAALAADLSKAGVAVTMKARGALAKATTDIQARAQTLAPVDTGYLRSSISSQVSRSGATLRGEVGPTANYARYVEEGTSHMGAQPFLRPATDAVVPQFQAAIEQLGGEAL